MHLNVHTYRRGNKSSVTFRLIYKFQLNSDFNSRLKQISVFYYVSLRLGYQHICEHWTWSNCKHKTALLIKFVFTAKLM